MVLRLVPSRGHDERFRRARLAAVLQLAEGLLDGEPHRLGLVHRRQVPGVAVAGEKIAQAQRLHYAALLALDLVHRPVELREGKAVWRQRDKAVRRWRVGVLKPVVQRDVNVGAREQRARAPQRPANGG